MAEANEERERASPKKRAGRKAKGKKKEALEIKKAEREKTYVDLVELGKFYFLNHRYDDALNEFKKALELAPQRAEVYYNMGMAYEGKNMASEAKEMYLKALELNPELAVAQERLNKIVGV